MAAGDTMALGATAREVGRVCANTALRFVTYPLSQPVLKAAALSGDCQRLKEALAEKKPYKKRAAVKSSIAELPGPPGLIRTQIQPHLSITDKACVCQSELQSSLRPPRVRRGVRRARTTDTPADLWAVIILEASLAPTVYRAHSPTLPSLFRPLCTSAPQTRSHQRGRIKCMALKHWRLLRRLVRQQRVTHSDGFYGVGAGMETGGGVCQIAFRADCLRLPQTCLQTVPFDCGKLLRRNS
ncbi:hypothetical protein MHYP_G00261570 [Metynnis hypsauchen]